MKTDGKEKDRFTAPLSIANGGKELSIFLIFNRIPGMVAYMRPFSVPATAGTLPSTYVRGGMVCL